MSTQQILAELDRMEPTELETVERHLANLKKIRLTRLVPSWNETLGALSGKARGLPEDFSERHDHYIHGKID